MIRKEKEVYELLKNPFQYMKESAISSSDYNFFPFFPPLPLITIYAS